MLMAVMLFLGVAQAILALYGRISYLFFYGIVLMLLSFVLYDGMHKLFRLIPLGACLGVCVLCIYRSSIYGMNYYYYDLIAVLNGLLGIFLLVSLLPDKRKKPAK